MDTNFLIFEFCLSKFQRKLHFKLLLHMTSTIFLLPMLLANGNFIDVDTIYEPSLRSCNFDIVSTHLSFSHLSILCKGPVLKSICPPPLPSLIMPFIPELNSNLKTGKSSPGFHLCAAAIQTENRCYVPCLLWMQTAPFSVYTHFLFPISWSKIWRFLPGQRGKYHGYARWNHLCTQFWLSPDF